MLRGQVKDELDGCLHLIRGGETGVVRLRIERGVFGHAVILEDVASKKILE
jgi:hypothetical protein